MKLTIRSLFMSLSFFLISLSSYAQEKAAETTTYRFKETSEYLKMHSLEVDVRNHRRDVFWPYTDSVERAQDFGVFGVFNTGESEDYEFDGQKLGARYGWQLDSTISWELQAGLHRVKALNINEDIEHWTLFGGGEVKLKHEKSIQKISAEYDLAYDELQIPAGLNQNLRALNLKYFLGYNFTKRQKVYSSLAQRYYSGSNSRSQVEASYLVKISEQEWSPWVGAGFAYLSTAKNVRGYWTPRNQTGFGPRLEWSYWLSEFFSASLESQIDHYYDATYKASGWSHYTALNFYIGDRNLIHGGLELVRMDSYQDGGAWYQNDVSLSLMIPF